MSDEIQELVEWQLTDSPVANLERQEAERQERLLTGDISARLWGVA
jgi:hypothetical protein